MIAKAGWCRGIAVLVVLLEAACKGRESGRRAPEPSRPVRAAPPAAPAAPPDSAALADSVALAGWQRFDFARDTVRASDLDSLSAERRALVRGIVFGRHGRVFKDEEIQDYLAGRSWYHPRADFDNDELNDVERHNLDVIRESETRSHPSIELGDMRFYRERRIAADQLEGRSTAELRILAAEVEAVHGRRFDDDPWLAAYFGERYWYRPVDGYDGSQLSEIERANLETIRTTMKRDRRLVLAPGDMGHFQRSEIREKMLHGLGLYELRLLRNEVYARRGMRFRTSWLARYFDAFEWYRPAADFGEPALSPVEDHNVRLIVAYESRLHEALASAPLDTVLLSGLFLEDARLLRYEIYARHGKVFPQRRLQGYFASLPWYQPNPGYREADLSEVERRNAALILAYEKGAMSAMDAFEG